MNTPNNAAALERLVDKARDTLRSLADELATLTQPDALTSQPSGEADDSAFADWIVHEMPAGTIIGSPQWWAPRIARAYRLTHPSADAPGVAVDEWRPIPGDENELIALIERWEVNAAQDLPASPCVLTYRHALAQLREALVAAPLSNASSPVAQVWEDGSGERHIGWSVDDCDAYPAGSWLYPEAVLRSMQARSVAIAMRAHGYMQELEAVKAELSHLKSAHATDALAPKPEGGHG